MVARATRSHVHTRVHRMPKMYGVPTKPAKRRPKLRAYFVALFWLGICSSFVYVLFLGPLFRVAKVEVKGAVFSDPKTFSSLVDLHQHIAFIPKQQIEYDILKHPAVESVQLLRGLPDSVRLVVVERKPTMAWVSQGTVNILDNEGRVFAQYPENALPPAESEIGRSIASINKVYDRQNMPVVLGQRIVSSLFIEFLSSVNKELGVNLKNYPVLQYEVTGSSFFDIQASFQGGLTADFNVLADAGVQARNLARLLDDAQVPTTSHIDLRIDRWAYVK